MSFPQISADKAASDGSKFFRLNTPITSMGDIYESAQGAQAFALGPNCDLATIRVSYFDSLQPGGVNSVVISPTRSFVGLIPARTDANYVKSPTRPGRTLISVDDIYDSSWRPYSLPVTGGSGRRAFDVSKDAIQYIAPQLDVIQYFAAQPSLVPQRSDKTVRLQYPTIPLDTTSGYSIYAIPMYGRKSGTVYAANYSTGLSVGFGVQLIRLNTNDLLSQWFDLLPTADITTSSIGASYAQASYKFSTHGPWDMMLILLGDAITGKAYLGGAFPITVTLSDNVL